MISAILFDLDGTLLDIDLGHFFSEYFKLLAPVVAEVTGISPQSGIEAVLAGTEAMSTPHPGRTNQEVFAERFAAVAGVELDASAWERFDLFYAEDFPRIQGAAGPAAGAHEALSTARELGLTVLIATNPIFPRAAIVERMRWAGISPGEVHAITTYEVMHATKPHADYYLQAAELAGAPPGECLMVGDDRVLDMSAADVGVKTYYTGPPPRAVADYAGSLAELAGLLPRLLDSES